MENPNSKLINLKHYVSVVSQLSFQAAQFAKECAQNPDLGKYDKGNNDPVTDADYKIQTYLIKGITHFFPDIRIVGEETVDYKGHIELNFQKIVLDNYPEDCELDQNVPLEDLCLWIDPIDNTKGFIKGRLDGVTILIGMTQKNSPLLGIIATPYRKQQGKNIFKPYLYMGYVPKKNAFKLQGGSGQKWQKIQKPKANNPLVLTTSDRKTNDAVLEIASTLETCVDRCGGSGNKINSVINGKTDAMIYINTSNCRWDSCAGDAIIKAMGGVFTNQIGQEINYEPNAQKYLNSEGNICTFDHELHKKIVKVYGQIAAKQK